MIEKEGGDKYGVCIRMMGSNRESTRTRGLVDDDAELVLARGNVNVEVVPLALSYAAQVRLAVREVADLGGAVVAGPVLVASAGSVAVAGTVARAGVGARDWWTQHQQPSGG